MQTLLIKSMSGRVVLTGVGINLVNVKAQRRLLHQFTAPMGFPFSGTHAN